MLITDPSLIYTEMGTEMKNVIMNHENYITQFHYKQNVLAEALWLPAETLGFVKYRRTSTH